MSLAKTQITIILFSLKEQITKIEKVTFTSVNKIILLFYILPDNFKLYITMPNKERHLKTTSVKCM